MPTCRDSESREQVPQECEHSRLPSQRGREDTVARHGRYHRQDRHVDPVNGRQQQLQARLLLLGNLHGGAEHRLLLVLLEAILSRQSMAGLRQRGAACAALVGMGVISHCVFFAGGLAHSMRRH